MKADVIMLVGYSNQPKADRLYDPVSEQIVVKRHLLCHEGKLGIPPIDRTEEITPDTSHWSYPLIVIRALMCMMNHGDHYVNFPNQYGME